MPRSRLALLLALLVGVGWVCCAGAPAATASAATPDGGWRWPLAGRPAVLRPFAAPATPYGPGHRGVDLAAARGAVVSAPGPGVVRYAGLLAGRGVVTLDHGGGLRTEYEPVDAAVRAGAPVRAGTPLGAVRGRHGRCPARCLHWGARRGATYIDPLTLLGAGPVRLLPLTVPGSGVAGAPAGPAGAGAAAADRGRVPRGAVHAHRSSGGPAPPVPPGGDDTLRLVASLTLLATGAVVAAIGTGRNVGGRRQRPP